MNDEVKISLIARTPRAIEEGEQISLSELQQMQIETSELDLADADAGHFPAVAVNDRWFMSFDFRRNKLTAAMLIQKAEEFCAIAEHALSQQHFAPAIDNLFSACEQAAKAQLITHAVVRGDVKKHGPIHSGINLWGKLGNVDREFVEMFNKLFRNREPARYTAGNGDWLINADMIGKARAEIAGLKARLKRYGDLA